MCACASVGRWGSTARHRECAMSFCTSNFPLARLPRIPQQTIGVLLLRGKNLGDREGDRGREEGEEGIEGWQERGNIVRELFGVCGAVCEFTQQLGKTKVELCGSSPRE